jgi:hypothetical protein
MPGDGLLRRDAPSTTRVITIDAPPGEVFPWLLQIGYGRGGWYSYDWVDNDGEPSVERIDPALQRLAVGERIQMLPGVGPVVHEIVPARYIVSRGETHSWCLLVEPTPDGRTRLISRWRQDWPKTASTYVWLVLADPGAFVMEQKMLRRIRDLAERNGAARRIAPRAIEKGPAGHRERGSAMAKRRIGRGILDALGGVPLFATAPLYRRWHLR